MIEFETRGLVGLATINRPERRNALNGDLCLELRDHFVASAELRAIVITGAGSAFCAGADLVTRFAQTEASTHGPVDTFRPAFEELLDAIVDHPSPVIAAVNGPAMGAGMQLAVACDLRIATPEAKFGIPVGRLGVHLSPRNIWRLAELAGQGAARDILLAGRVLDGDEAARIGVVQRIDDDALAAALALADQIAASAPLSVRGHKRSLNLVAEAQWLSEQARAEVAALEKAAFASADLQEGMAAFAEKRTPNFQGR
jgi:enoyl-CoA hydratase